MLTNCGVLVSTEDQVVDSPIAHTARSHQRAQAHRPGALTAKDNEQRGETRC